MIALCNIFNRIELLPNFVSYYGGMGITQFVFGIWNGKDNPLWEKIEQLDIKNIVLEPSFTGSFCGLNDSESQNILREKYVPKDEWFVIADLDEFHALPPYKSFVEITRKADKENAETILSEFVDRITIDGTIPSTIDNTCSLWEQFPINSQITKDILGGFCLKVMMAKNHVKINSGHHPIDQYRRFSEKGITYHFKWWGDLMKYQTERWHTYENMKLPWFKESKILVEHIQKYGKISI